MRMNEELDQLKKQLHEEVPSPKPKPVEGDPEYDPTFFETVSNKKFLFKLFILIFMIILFTTTGFLLAKEKAMNEAADYANAAIYEHCPGAFGTDGEVQAPKGYSPMMVIDEGESVGQEV